MRRENTNRKWSPFQWIGWGKQQAKANRRNTTPTPFGPSQPSFADDALRLFRAISRTLCSAQAETEALQAICDALVSFHTCAQARVGLVDDADPNIIRFVATAGRSRGEAKGQLEHVFRVDGDGIADAVPLVRALATGVPAVCSLNDNSYFSRWFAAGGGNAFGTVIPLRGDDTRLGVLALSTADAGLFSKTMLPFFQEIADVVAAKVGCLRARVARERAEQATQESETLLQAVLDGTSALLTVRDSAGHVVRVLAGEQSLPPGFTTPNLAKTCSDMPVSRVVADLAENERHLIAAGETLHVECELDRPPHAPRVVWTTRGVLSAPSGAHSGFYEVVHDITDFRRMQAQARVNVARYHNLFQTAGDAFLTFNDAFAITECNGAAERLFGAPYDTLCSGPIERWFDESAAEPTGLQTLLETLQHALEGKPASAVVRCLRSNGKPFDGEVQASRFEDQGRNKVLVSVCDITRQNQAAVQLLRVSRERTVLSSISQMLVRADSEEALFAGGCRALAVSGGYPKVWAVRREGDTVAVLAYGHSVSDEAQAAFQKRTQPDASGCHPLIDAIRQGTIEVFRAQAVGVVDLDRWLIGFTEDVQACATLPLWDGATLCGALVVGVTARNTFASEEMEFLKELSRGLSFGVTAVRSRLARLTAEQKRHETAELMRNAIEGSNDFIYVADFQGRYLQFLNCGGLRRYGIIPDRVVGRTPVQVWGPELGRQAMDRYQQILANGAISQGEVTIRSAGGDMRHLWVTNGPLRSEDGKLQGVFGVLRDVTDFRRAERVLRVNSERLEVLQSLVSSDYDSEIDLIRAGMAEIIRITKSVVGFFNPVEGDQVHIHMQVRRGGETIDAPFLPQSTVLPLLSTPWAECAQSGKTQVVNVGTTPFGDGNVRLAMTRFACVPVVVNNQVAVLAGVANKADDYEEIDVLQIRLFMESLWQLVLRRRADQQSRLLLAANEQSMSAVLILEASGIVTYVNQAFERMYAVRRDELIGENMGSAKFRAKIGDEAYVQLYDAFNRKDVFIGEMTRVRPDDTICVCEGGIYPVRNASGVITHYASVQRDVTAERDLRLRLEQSQKLELVGHLTGGIAHDFNNLLQVINGYSEYLLHQMAADHPFRNEINEIYDAGRRATHMTGRLLAFSRRKVARQNAVCLNRIIQELEKMLRRIIGETIELRTVLSPEVPECIADSSQIEQVLLNLCVNARDAMPNGGLLSIQTEVQTLDAGRAAALKMPPGQAVELTVSDTGSGMTSEVLSHLFEPFFTTKERGKGTGLGLATVYGIVMQHNGHIGFTSQSGQGASCRILLPVSKEIVEPDVPEDAVVLPGLRGNGEWLLVAEDEGPVRKILVQTLETYGYYVLAAYDGSDALKIYEANRDRIAMIICDVCMPGKGGLEMEEELRTTYEAPPPVLFVTGYADVADTLRSAGEEIELVLKPVPTQELLQRVRAIIDASRRSAAPANSAHDAQAPRSCLTEQ